MLSSTGLSPEGCWFLPPHGLALSKGKGLLWKIPLQPLKDLSTLQRLSSQVAHRRGRLGLYHCPLQMAGTFGGTYLNAFPLIPVLRVDSSSTHFFQKEVKSLDLEPPV